ncbi:MAG: transcriptional regulator with XRE-family HTH domain [Alphaproteobacteria bacterium]|jgi:transcriptional regulator with XRE-family HTH domain
MATPDPVDLYVGSRVRMRRTVLGLSQEKLADQLGITFQQVQKYENGSNRVGSSRLYAISRILSVPVSFMFDGYDDSGKLIVSEEVSRFDKQMRSRETIELMKSYYSIKDEHLRRKVLDMVKAMPQAMSK